MKWLVALAAISLVGVVAWTLLARVRWYPFPELAMSPDGQKVALKEIAHRPSDRAVWGLRRGYASLNGLFRRVARKRLPAWHPQGTVKSRVVVFDAATRRGETVYEGTEWLTVMEWVSERELAFCPGIHSNLFLWTEGDREPVRVAGPALSAILLARVASSSRGWALLGVEGPPRKLALYRSAGGKTTSSVPPYAGSGLPLGVAADGSWAAIIEYRNGGRAVVIFDTSTGKVIREYVDPSLNPVSLREGVIIGNTGGGNTDIRRMTATGMRQIALLPSKKDTMVFSHLSPKGSFVLATECLLSTFELKSAQLVDTRSGAVAALNLPDSYPLDFVGWGKDDSELVGLLWPRAERDGTSGWQIVSLRLKKEGSRWTVTPDRVFGSPDRPIVGKEP